MGKKVKDSVNQGCNFLALSPEKTMKNMIDNDIVIDLCSSPGSDQKGTPFRPIFCLKNRETMREMEEMEECFILEFDPDYPSHFSNSSSITKNLQASPDISVVAERGQVACRDYPHSRHLCVKYPFAKTPHESYCELCYCYVCDVAAPCKMWTGNSAHCHAIDNEAWKLQRNVERKSLNNPA